MSRIRGSASAVGTVMLLIPAAIVATMRSTGERMYRYRLWAQSIIIAVALGLWPQSAYACLCPPPVERNPQELLNAATRAQQDLEVLGEETMAVAVDGYYVSPEDLALSLPSAISDTCGDYRVLVERTYGSPKEARLLRIAEALYPPRDTLEAAIARAHFKLDDVPDVKDLWWSSSFDGIRLPYAITGRAVHYYLDLIESFKRGDFDGTNGIRMQSGSLTYTATIDRQAVFERPGRRLEDVYVARLTLSWSNHCGPLCALGFQQDRVVVLSPKGEVLWVSGDRPPFAFVS